LLLAALLACGASSGPSNADPVDYAPSYTGTFLGFLGTEGGTGFDLIPTATLTEVAKNQLRFQFQFLDPDRVVCDDGTGVSLTTSANGVSITGQMHCQVSNDPNVGTYQLDFLGTGHVSQQTGPFCLPDPSLNICYTTSLAMTQTLVHMDWTATLSSGAVQAVRLLWVMAPKSQIPDYAAIWSGTYSGTLSVQGGGSDQISSATIARLDTNSIGLSFTFLDTNAVKCDSGAGIYIATFANNQAVVVGRQHCTVYNDPTVGTYTLDFQSPGTSVYQPPITYPPIVFFYETWKATFSDNSTQNASVLFNLTQN
jgi:hypothetical protein